MKSKFASQKASELGARFTPARWKTNSASRHQRERRSGGVSRWQDRTWAVSYTHLDVYKRQGVDAVVADGYHRQAVLPGQTEGNPVGKNGPSRGKENDLRPGFLHPPGESRGKPGGQGPQSVPEQAGNRAPAGVPQPDVYKRQPVQVTETGSPRQKSTAVRAGSASPCQRRRASQFRRPWSHIPRDGAASSWQKPLQLPVCKA